MVSLKLSQIELFKDCLEEFPSLLQLENLEVYLGFALWQNSLLFQILALLHNCR